MASITLGERVGLRVELVDKLVVLSSNRIDLNLIQQERVGLMFLQGSARDIGWTIDAFQISEAVLLLQGAIVKQ